MFHTLHQQAILARYLRPARIHSPALLHTRPHIFHHLFCQCCFDPVLLSSHKPNCCSLAGFIMSCRTREASWQKPASPYVSLSSTESRKTPCRFRHRLQWKGQEDTGPPRLQDHTEHVAPEAQPGRAAGGLHPRKHPHRLAVLPRLHPRLRPGA